MSAAHQELAIELPGGCRVLFTDRSHGNLSSVGGEGSERGEEARARLRSTLGLRALARGYQVHGTRVRWRDALPGEPDAAPRPGEDDADGQATGHSLLGAMVLSADCLPVALAGAGAAASIHAGWRGLAGGVLEAGIAAVRGAAGRDTALAAVIGPGAGACCYEVGPEVHAALTGERRTAPARIDLRALAEERLRAAGVDDVRHVEACTICDERFFSHRREGPRAGRQAGLTWLP